MVTSALGRLVGSAPRSGFADGASASALSSLSPIWGGRRSSSQGPYGAGTGSSSQALYGAETGPSANPPTYSKAHYYAPEPEENRSQEYDPGYETRPGGWCLRHPRVMNGSLCPPLALCVARRRFPYGGGRRLYYNRLVSGPVGNKRLSLSSCALLFASDLKSQGPLRAVFRRGQK